MLLRCKIEEVADLIRLRECGNLAILSYITLSLRADPDFFLNKHPGNLVPSISYLSSTVFERQLSEIDNKNVLTSGYLET